jgi:hypothetical protein
MSKLIFILSKNCEDDRGGVSFKGLGKVFCDLGAFSIFKPQDLDNKLMIVHKYNLNPDEVKEELDFHNQLWNYLSNFKIKNTEMVPKEIAFIVLSQFMNQPKYSLASEKIRKDIIDFMHQDLGDDFDCAEYYDHVVKRLDAQLNWGLTRLMKVF